MNLIICIGLFLPLVSFLFITFFNQVLTRNSVVLIACGAVLFSFFCFFQFLFDGVESYEVILFKILDLKNLKADFTLRLDHLSLLMTLIITGVGFLIHVYSIGYMDHEKDYARYFAFLNFFIFAMLLLVLAGNLLLLFAGWEGVGLASYLLIGYWFTKEEAAKAATKAFIVNRIGDFGFILGILLAFYLFGSVDIDEIAKNMGQFDKGSLVLTAFTLLLFMGAVGKSAQIPLHVWLPDAMAGPTPVSALIHAATMVTAGVYLIVKLHMIYLQAPFTMQIIGVTGGVTALFAALAAIAQTDLKKVLAYSTISQLGFMFLACGTGAFYSAMFHLTMHAFIKALLFLSAGNVVHMMGGATHFDQMGGLAKKFPVTHFLFLIGVLSLAGVPPFAAFFSKDLILEQEFLAGCTALFYIALAASVLTAIYLTRAYMLVFWGKPAKTHDDVREAPWVMLIPVMVLAFLALTGGFLGAEIGKIPILESFLSEVGVNPIEKSLTPGFIGSKESYMAIFGAFMGMLIPLILYGSFKNRLGKNIQLLNKAFYFDKIYEVLFVKPLKTISSLIQSFVEPDFFSHSLNIMGRGISDLGALLQGVQDGQIRSYAALMVIGAFVLLIFYF